MDDGGALPRNVAKKSSTSTGRSKPPKRLLPPNLTKNIINPKKSKSLSLSSNSETFHSANSSSITLDSVETVNSSENLEIINETLDVSENVQRPSNRDLEELQDLTDKEDSHKYTNKRIIKVPKYTDFITNNDMEKIIGVGSNALNKKATKKKSKSRKVKPPVVVINDLQIKENLKDKPSELNNESNEFGSLGTMSSNKKRKKLSSNETTKNKHEKLLLDNSLTDLEINESASSSSSFNSNTIYKRTTRSSTGAISNKKIAKVEKNQPCILKKYDANIEKIVSDKNHTETISKSQEQTDKHKNDFKAFTPNVGNATSPEMPEIKTEDDVCPLNPDRIVTNDLESVKIEAMSPCSSTSDLSELFSPIRDCHIHLERLSINSKVPNERLVVNSFDKIIPNCRCKGVSSIEKKSRNNVVSCAQQSAEQKINNCTLQSAIEIAQNKLIYTSAQPQTKCIPTSFNLPYNKTITNTNVSESERVALDPTSNIQSKDSSKKRKSSHSELVRIFNLHIDAVIEEVIKCNTIESPEKEDIKSFVKVQKDTNKEIEEKSSSSRNETLNEDVSNKNTNEKEHNTKEDNEKSTSSRHERKSSATLKEDVSVKNTNEEKHKIKEDSKRTVTRSGRKSGASNKEDNKKSRHTLSSNERKLPIKLKEDISIENTHAATNKEHKIKEDNKKSRTTSSSKNEIELPVKLMEEIVTEGPHHIVTNKEDHTITEDNKKSTTFRTEMKFKDTEQVGRSKEKHKIKEDNKKSSTKPKNERSLPVKLNEDILTEDTHDAVTNKEENKSEHSSSRNERKLPVKVKENISTKTTENKHHINTNKVEHRIKEDNKKPTTSRNEMKLKEDISTKIEQKIEPPSPEKIEATFPSLQKINNSTEKVLNSPEQKSSQNAVKLTFGDTSTINVPQNQECTISRLDENAETKNMIKENVKNLEQSDEFNMSSNESSSADDKSDFDLRQILLEKREKEKTDASFNKYKNFIIQASANSNRIILNNSEENVLPKTLKISPTKSTLIQLNKSPIKDNIRQLFQSNEPNNGENKGTKSPEIKICVLGKTLVRSNSDNSNNFNKESHISEMVTQKLNKIFSDRQKLEENETEIENQTREQTQNEISETSKSAPQQNNNNNFVFTKPKHTFKFIGKSVVKRPPTRRPSKITLKRPKLESTPQPSHSQTVFKAPIEKKKEIKLNAHDSTNKYTMDDDIISILADTSGLESVVDAASVKNIDSDDEDDIKVNETFMDKERFTQVEDWLSNSVEEPATVIETTLSPVIKKTTEIPIARVNPGIQVSKSEEKSLSNESNNTERMNIKLIPEEPKIERPFENELFKNICYTKFRKDYCPRKGCIFEHTLPNNWERILRSCSIDALMRNYRHVRNHNLMCLYKRILSIVAGQLGSFNDFNNLTNLVKDVLKIKMNTDREPLIKDIIEALIHNGFSYYSTVEIVFRCVNVEQNYKNLLCDILLNLTVERKQLEDDWPIIQMLSVYKKFDIDKGIIQFIIIEALAKNYLQKELILKVYNDLIKKIPDFNMKTISATLCQKFTEMLRKYKLISDADELLNRCISLNILEKPHKTVIKEGILKDSSVKHEEMEDKCAINEPKLFDFSPQLITTQNPPILIDFTKPPPNYLHTNQPKQEHFVNLPPSNPQYQPQQEHSQRTLNQYQPEQKCQMQYQPHLPQKQELVQQRTLNTYQLQKEHSNFPQSQNQYQQEHLNLIQKQEQAQYQIQQEHSYQHQPESQHEYIPEPKCKSQYQPQQEHKNQDHLMRVFNDTHRNRSSNQNNSKSLPLLADKGMLDQQNYTEYFRNKSYSTESHELAQPSTSQANNTTMMEQKPTMPNDTFCYSTENLHLLANTAMQNLLGLARDGDINKTLSSPELKQFAYNFLARDNKTDRLTSPGQVERHAYDDQSYAAQATNPKGHAASTGYNFSDVKKFVAEENFASIMQLILKYKEGNATDAFLSYLIGALIETPHNYPTFFITLSDMSALSNDMGLNYMLKTIGVNLVMHLCQNNQYDPAFRLNLILTGKYQTSDFYDIYNCKIYLKNNYSYFRRILIIAQMYIIKGDIQTSWKILRDTCGSYLQSNNDEADLKYRDFVLGKLFESFKKIKNWHIALDALLYLMKYKSTDTNIREHANSILVNAINNLNTRCDFEKIEEFMNISPDWFQHLGKNTIRALLVTACLSNKNCVTNLYRIALNLRIYPQLMGNEKTITLDGRFHYAELQLFLDKYFQNMVNFMPITDHIKITFIINEETSDDEIPLLVHQYNSSKSVLAGRVAKILETKLKPPIQVFNRNNCLYLEPESVNTHLLYRQQSSL